MVDDFSDRSMAAILIFRKAVYKQNENSACFLI